VCGLGILQEWVIEDLLHGRAQVWIGLKDELKKLFHFSRVFIASESRRASTKGDFQLAV
jgi:hypothetical protein